MALWQWAKVAITNQTADPTINWSEGQAPSTINDSDRAMMARIAEWRDDFSGALTLAGGPVAYTVTTNQGLNTPTPTTGQLLSFVPNVGNGASPTLAADGGTAFPIQTAAGVAVASGTLVAGTPYSVSFSGSAWVLFSTFTNPSVVPVGGMILWSATSQLPNSNYAWVNGQAISRTTYSVLFSLISTYYGTGDGSSTFNIPNLNGVAVFGLDAMGGSTARNTITTGNSNWNGQSLGAPYYGALGNVGTENRTQTAAQVGQHSHGITEPNSNQGHQHTADNAGTGHHFVGSNATVSWGTTSAGTVTAMGADTPSEQRTDLATITTAFQTTGISINNSPVAATQAMPTMPPGISLPIVMRIL